MANNLSNPTPVVITDANGIPVASAGPGLAAEVQITNFPATQPVSISGTLPVSGTVSVNNFPASQPVTGTFFPGTQPVSIASMPSTPVTGTFWQSTQPVSGTFWQATQPVSGTFWQATQPVSIASMPSTPVTGTFWQATQPVSGTVTVTPPTLTKGTQGATGFSVQDLKDSGRVLCTFTASAVTGVTTEGLITLTPYRDLVAGSTGSTFAVTANKRLRLQTLVVTWRNNTAAAGAVTVRLRLLAGTVLVGSPVHASLNATTSSAAIGGGNTSFIDLPDGFELSGTMQFGLTQLALGAVVGFDVHVIGYEY